MVLERVAEPGNADVKVHTLTKELLSYTRNEFFGHGMVRDCSVFLLCQIIFDHEANT